VGKVLVIGAAGLIGDEVVKALGESECIRASRSSAEPVDISDPKSIAALFGRIGEVDGIVCTGGAARFKPWDQLTDEDWTFSLGNKPLGQVNVVRYGLKSVRPGGAITLTTGLASQYPAPGSAIITTVKFRRGCVRPRGGRRAFDYRAGQRCFAGLGVRDLAGHGPQPFGWHSGG
jgi:NAD(P)-dependent dehydrogenase (short-subunit alcohol dehydrogenase family)